jgi:peptidoglycan/xylan/chitin deacetylase (PgdA/CDA1 family)
VWRAASLCPAAAVDQDDAMTEGARRPVIGRRANMLWGMCRGDRLAAVMLPLVLAACTAGTVAHPPAVPNPSEPGFASPAPLASGSIPAPASTASSRPSRPARAARPAHPVPAPPIPAYVNRGSPARQWIALTFDADMYPWMYAERDRVSFVDRRIVDVLERTQTRATIFVNGLFVRAYPKLVERLARNPNIELANHSWDHAGWTTDCPNTTPIAPPMTERTEVTKTAAIVRQLTGVRIRYFRFPGFCHSPSEVAYVRSLGEYSIGSDCFFGDALGWSVDRQVDNVIHSCRHGSIVVTHINGPPFHPNVYEALERLIPWWKANGWSVVTVGQMLGHSTPRPPG